MKKNIDLQIAVITECTNNTLFQAASIGKSINAFGYMKLVQDKKVDLNKDINLYLKSWQFHFVYIAGGIFGAIFFALIYNLLPAYKPFADVAILIGASASVMAIFTALTTLVPNYTLHLLLIGPIKIKYLLAVYIFLDIIAIEKFDGGSLSHLGGAFLGFIYIKLLQSGTDLTKIFERKPKLKVVRNQEPRKSTNTVNQREVDAVLDKISKSGYDKLSKEEKEILFRASKN
ncbi:MAG: rhomboid family intramembrane serine protease [Pedobacter sp.]|nr:MAG: rhomboid family intramembrane serine protease [Pedobacter sp.]